jgi:hypothetical protein
LVFRLDADLFDVREPVDLIDEQVANRSVILIDRNPAAPGVHILDELFDRPWFIVGNVVQSDAAELLTGAAFDHTKGRGFFGTSQPHGCEHRRSLAPG